MPDTPPPGLVVPVRGAEQPYRLPVRQDFAVATERQRNAQALYLVGEWCFFALMWHLEDFQAGLVVRCITCYGTSPVAAAYGQGRQNSCPDCYGTTFEGGYKALIIRPAVFSDTDEGETRTRRGVARGGDITVESTPDFRVRSGDYVFRPSGERYYLRIPDRVTARTGFGPPYQSSTAIGYNHARASDEDPSSPAYLIPPPAARLPQILTAPLTATGFDGTPADFSAFEIVRAPLIPAVDRA
jgi:hypothetical protein